MKSRIFFTVVFFIIFGCFSNIYCISSSQNDNYKNQDSIKGLELSNELYSFLVENNFNPDIQDLVLNGKNKFPYNITVTIKNDVSKDTYFIFTFYQEDAIRHKELIKNLIYKIEERGYNFNTIFLFSYGENQQVSKNNMIFGVDTFLESINTNDDYSNILVNLSSNENSITTSSKGITSPSWLIQNEYNTYIKNNIDENIPYFYLSQMYTYKFYYDRLLSDFFDYNIPSIKLNFAENKTEDDVILSVLLDSIESYNFDNNRNWDQHFFMARINKHFKKLTEEKTVQIIIVIIFVWLLFILLFIFIITRMKKQAWGTIKHIWYIMPVTFALSIIGFIIGKYISINLLKTDSVIYNVFILTESQIIVAFILVSIFYAITLSYNYWFYEKSIDYLIVISCFLNQSFFILIDISLFPIFMAICLLSIIALSVKSNGFHIAIFFLMTVPFIPYILSMIDYSDFYALYNFLISEHLISLFVPLIIYPSFIIYFRILTSIRRKSKISIPILISVILIAISVLIVFIGTLKGVSLTKTGNYKEKDSIVVETSPDSEDFINFSYSDKRVFDDLVRTLNINFSEQPEQCNVYVESVSLSPILYTENDYEYITQNKYMFNIPSTPPRNLVFSYGTSTTPSVITISAIFPTNDEFTYIKTEKVVKIEK